jgi:hypothetical protein
MIHHRCHVDVVGDQPPAPHPPNTPSSHSPVCEYPTGKLSHTLVGHSSVHCQRACHNPLSWRNHQRGIVSTVHPLLTAPLAHVAGHSLDRFLPAAFGFAVQADPASCPSFGSTTPTPSRFACAILSERHDVRSSALAAGGRRIFYFSSHPSKALLFCCRA